MSKSVKRPEPLLSRAAIVGTIGGLVTALVAFGVVPAATGKVLENAADGVVSALAVLVAVVGPLVHAKVSRKAVTPVSDPQDASGAKLVPAGSAPATLDAAKVLEAAEAVFHGGGEAAPVEDDYVPYVDPPEVKAEDKPKPSPVAKPDAEPAKPVDPYQPNA